MNKNLSILMFIVLVLSCSSAKKNKTQEQKIFQGIEGIVVKLVSNQMPMVDAPKPQPIPVSLTVCIYDSTNIKDVVQLSNSPFYSSIKTQLVATIQSDSTGHFKVSLPVGKYSIFTKVKGQFYSNLYDEKNNLFLVTVEKNKLTNIQIKVDVDATY